MAGDRLCLESSRRSFQPDGCTHRGAGNVWLFPLHGRRGGASQLNAVVLINSNQNSRSTFPNWHGPQLRAESNTAFHLFRWLTLATQCSCTVQKRMVDWSLAWTHPIADLLLDRNHHQRTPQLVAILRWRPPTPNFLETCFHASTQ